MITVSDEWKNVHKQMLLPESYVRIQLEVIDKTAYAVTPSFDNQASFSTPGDVVNNRKPLSPTKYALLEYNMWSLDGSFPLADDYKDFWDFGAVSKDDSEFTLGLDLHEVRSSEAPAFTITWSTNYNECATDFTVDLKNGDNVVATTRVTGNSNCVSNILLSACEYDSVEITVHEWSLPIHRARIESVIFGYALVFNKDQIMSYTHEQHGDPVSGEISRSSITFSLDNSDDKWNPLNPNGLEKYLYEQQKVLVYYGMDVLGSIEWVQAGVFYLSEWRVPSTGMEATFVANDAFALLTSDYSKNALCDICRPADGTSIYAYSDLGGSVTGDGKKTDIAGWKGIEILENSSYSKIEGDTDPYSEERQKYYRTRHGWVLQDEVEIISDRTLGGTVDEVLETVPFQITPC